MKRTSILLTVLLVVSLLFAVSCPNKDPSINVTSDKSAIEKNLQDVDKNIPLGVTIDIAHDAFSDKVATGANVIDWFTLSDGTEAEKATLISATVSSVSEKKDSVTVSLVAEAKAVTEANKPVKLTVAIPEATADAVWTTSKKAIKETNANAIAITIVDKASVKASITSGNPVSFTIGQADVEKNVTVALVNGTFASTDGISVTRADGAEISHIEFNGYTIGTGASANELSITVKSLTDIAQEDGGLFKINIPSSAITPSSDDYVKTDLSVELTVNVNSAGGNVNIRAAHGNYVWLTKEGTVPIYTGSNPNEATGNMDVYFADFPIEVKGAKFNDALLGTDKLLYKNDFNNKDGVFNDSDRRLYITFSKSSWGDCGYLIKGEEEGLYYVRIYVPKTASAAEHGFGGTIYFSPKTLVPDEGWTNISENKSVKFTLWGLPITIACDNPNVNIQQGGTATTTFTITGGTWDQLIYSWDNTSFLLINDDDLIGNDSLSDESFKVENQGFTYSFEKEPTAPAKVKLTITATDEVPAATYDKSLVVWSIFSSSSCPISYIGLYSPYYNRICSVNNIRGDVYEVPFKLTVTAK